MINYQIVKLPKINPHFGYGISGDTKNGDNYIVIDRRPKLNEWYINVYATYWARSIQNHTHIRHIKNHKKDYRWKYCMVVVASDNPIFKFPTCEEWLKNNSSVKF